MIASIPPRVTLVLGGVRSGKSAYAESLFAELPRPWAYIATAEALDPEMSERIRAHQARRGPDWISYEAPTAITEVLMTKAAERPALVECLTLWLSNLMHLGSEVQKETELLVEALGVGSAPRVLVSNEVGLGIMPSNDLARAFSDQAGKMNQRLAAIADRVVFVAAGLPLVLKG